MRPRLSVLVPLMFLAATPPSLRIDAAGARSARAASPDPSEVARESVLDGATSDPAAISWGSGRLDIFVRGGDNALWQKSFSNGAWSGWASLGGSLASGPDVSSWGPDRLDVFARGADNTLIHTWYDRGWAGRWESLGGNLTSDPAAVSWGSGRIDVFARGADNALWHVYYAGGWSPWESLGGAIIGGPAVSSWGSGRLDVFVRGTDNAMHHRWFEGSWSGWGYLGGALTSDPSAVAWGSGRIDVFARGADNALHHKWFDGAWSQWESFPGGLTSGPDAASWAAGRLDVVALGTDGNWYHRWYGGSWSPWGSLGAPPATALVLAAPTTGTITPTMITSIPVTITGLPSSLVVTWPAVPNAELYKIDRVKEGDPCCNRSVSVGPSVTSMTDAVPATVGSIYQYTVTALTAPNHAQVVLRGSYLYDKLDVQFAPVNRRVAAVDPCAPAQTTGGVPPGYVDAQLAATTRPLIKWAAVPGAAAYLVERRNRATSTWYRLACLPATEYTFGEVTRSDLPKEETPYPVSGYTYTYKVTAFTSTGAAGWNSGVLRMKPMYGPGSLTSSRTGNAVNLCWSPTPNDPYERPNRFRITSSYGTDYSVPDATFPACPSTYRGTTVLGVPEGTHTFTVTAQYYARPNYLEYGPATISVTVVP